VPYPRAIYHPLNRGDHPEPIFLDHKNQRMLLHTRSEAPEKAGCEIYAGTQFPGQGRPGEEAEKACADGSAM
jgi:hypothetical protein